MQWKWKPERNTWNSAYLIETFRKFSVGKIYKKMALVIFYFSEPYERKHSKNTFLCPLKLIHVLLQIFLSTDNSTVLYGTILAVLTWNNYNVVTATLT